MFSFCVRGRFRREVIYLIDLSKNIKPEENQHFELQCGLIELPWVPTSVALIGLGDGILSVHRLTPPFIAG